MKIHFCDLCNESVPQADLDNGRAFIRKGRVVCASCEGAMSHAAPPSGVASTFAPAGAERSPDVAPALPGGEPHAHVSHLQPIVVRSAGSGGLWVALLGLVFTGGVMFVLDNRIQVLQRDQNDLSKRVDARDGEFAMIQRGAALANDSQREYEKKNDARFESARTRSDKLVDDLNEMRTRNDEMSARIASLTVLVNKHEAKAGSGDIELEKRLSDLSSRLAKSEDDLQALSRRVQTVEETPLPVTPAPVEPAAAEGPASAEPGWQVHLAGLANDSNSVRWEAVTALGATKDLATVPYIVPMLKDLDVFVRMAAARVLGEMGAKSAVPNLIDALEDEQTAVREAAFIALRTITGKDLKFDPQAVDAERTKRVKAWREWWKKESESAPSTPAGS